MKLSLRATILDGSLLRTIASDVCTHFVATPEHCTLQLIGVDGETWAVTIDEKTAGLTVGLIQAARSAGKTLKGPIT